MSIEGGSVKENPFVRSAAVFVAALLFVGIGFGVYEELAGWYQANFPTPPLK